MSKWSWCLVTEDDSLATGWNQVGSNWFYFWSNGSMAIGWLKLNDKFYYMDADGSMITGWKQIEGKWYYFETESNGNKGVMYSGITATIGDKQYTFNNDGSWVDTNNLVSDDCITFVKGYEGFYAYKYDDGTGVITQGYGCIGQEIADWGDTITEQQASDRLKELINNKYAKPIKSDLDSKGVLLTQNQLDALISMAYNIGTDGLLGSSLYKYIVSGGRDANTIKTDFCMWSRAGGQVMTGLYKRRCAEAKIFNEGVYDSTH